MKQSLPADARVLHLLVELLKDGRAGIIPELAEYEPIAVDQILEALRLKTNFDKGSEKEAWYRWFLEEFEDATANERDTLKLLKKMLDDERHFAERITKKRDP